jgi:hypothetical protein
MAQPVNTPTSDHNGPVLQLVSAHSPRAAKPSVGTNILHVVSAIVANIKTTGDLSGVEAGESDLSDGTLISYKYTAESCVCKAGGISTAYTPDYLHQGPLPRRSASSRFVGPTALRYYEAR